MEGSPFRMIAKSDNEVYSFSDTSMFIGRPVNIVDTDCTRQACFGQVLRLYIGGINKKSHGAGVQQRCGTERVVTIHRFELKWDYGTMLQVVGAEKDDISSFLFRLVGFGCN